MTERAGVASKCNAVGTLAFGRWLQSVSPIVRGNLDKVKVLRTGHLFI